MRAFVLGLALVAAPAMAADQFDLVCREGKTTTRYRVDLKTGEACFERCDRVWKMGQSTSSELKILDRPAASRGDSEERTVVNRLTGEWHSFSMINGRSYIHDGKCEPDAFSGFPAPKF